MPIPDTKYNIIITNTKLYKDLSNISLFHNPNALDNNCDSTNEKIYLTNKAEVLIKKFSKVSNCISQFGNEKSLFDVCYNKIVGQENSCHSCVNNATTSNSETHTQKIIQNQVRVPSSLYTMNLRNLYIRSDLSNNENPHDNRSDQKTPSIDLKKFKGVDIKHNSYSRYLGKKVANSLT
tara:strand:- start:74 stop:610 length:537 start_codon:yes stop_codon:yes gene_type:complete